MTIEQIYKKALADATNAFQVYTLTCERIREGRETEQAANTDLNSLIAVCWSLKSAALAKEPAPLKVTRQQQRNAAKAATKEK